MTTELEPAAESQPLVSLPVQLMVTEEGMILKRGCSELRIVGERAAELVQTMLAIAVEGKCTREQICERFAAPDRPAVASLIEQLESRRFVVPAGPRAPDVSTPETNLDVFYWHFGQPEQILERLSSRHVVILGVNFISRQLILSLTRAGLKNVEVVDFPLLRNVRLFTDTGELSASQWPESLNLPVDYGQWAQGFDPQTADCLVATSDFGALEVLREWNELCVTNKCHFLPVVLQDLIGYVGPLFVPGESACFECLLGRQNANMGDAAARRASGYVGFEGQAITGIHPAMASVLGDMASLELTKFFGIGLPWWEVGTMVELNLLVASMRPRKILRLPRCPVCSELNRRSSTSIHKNTGVGSLAMK